MAEYYEVIPVKRSLQKDINSFCPYVLSEDGRAITGVMRKDEPPRPLRRMRHNSNYEYHRWDTFANRAICSEYVTVVAGDNPTAALLVFNPEHNSTPFQHKLGALTGEILVKGQWIPFDKAEENRSDFAPGETLHLLTFDDGTQFELRIGLIEKDGMIATLCAKQVPSGSVQVKWKFGGFQHISRAQVDDGCWYKQGMGDVRSRMELIYTRPGCAKFSSMVADDTFDWQGEPPIAEVCSISFCGSMDLHSSVADDQAVVEQPLGKNQIMAMAAVYSRPDHQPDVTGINTIDEAEVYLRISRKRYENLLDRCATEVPSSMLKAGIMASVMNFEDVRCTDGWLEMRQWWLSYITNNYQIGAAVALGDYECAKKALLFFGLQEGGYVLLLADGKSVPPYRNAFDGLLYYIPQLYRYTMQTGDFSVFEQVYGNVTMMIDKMEEFRIQDSDGLFSYRLGCNMFMYQADHIGMPGASASASLMMAHCYNLFARLCHMQNRTAQAQRYQSKAESLNQAISRRLWDEKRGCFYSHIDLQGQAHKANYYTDLVFPQLYSDLPLAYRYQSLDSLKQRLVFPSKTTGLPLMQVGDFKPTIFSNDNVMPTQIAEVCIALLQTGDIELALGLLESVSLAATVYTDSPGSMPERMSDEGRGEPNYKLGNGIASFIQCYIIGLFGLYRDECGRCLHVEPAFPDDWDSASLHLPYGGFVFTRDTVGTIQLNISCPDCETVALGVVLPPCANVILLIDGVESPLTLEPLLGHSRLCARIVTNGRNQIAVTIRPKIVRNMQLEPLTAIEGEPVISGLKPVFSHPALEGNAQPGQYRVPVCSEAATCYLEQAVTVLPRAAIRVLELPARGDHGYAVQLMAELPAERRVQCQVKCFSLEGAPFLLNQVLESTNGIFAAYREVDSVWPCGFTAWLEVTFSRVDTGDVIYTESRSVRLRSPFDARRMQLTSLWREQLALDEEIYVDSGWRSGMKTIGIVGYGSNRRVYDRDGHWFMLTPSSDEKDTLRFLLLSGGRSDPATRDLVPGDYRTEVTLPVGQTVRTLELAYVAETEARLTGSCVGVIELRYDSGNPQIISLQSGRNIGALFHNFASETDKFPLFGDDLEPNNDFGNILSIGCDVNRCLEEVIIRISTRDTYIALLAATAFI